jgi:hypothetical protein
MPHNQALSQIEGGLPSICNHPAIPKWPGGFFGERARACIEKSRKRLTFIYSEDPSSKSALASIAEKSASALEDVAEISDEYPASLADFIGKWSSSFFFSKKRPITINVSIEPDISLSPYIEQKKNFSHYGAVEIASRLEQKNDYFRYLAVGCSRKEIKQMLSDEALEDIGQSLSPSALRVIFFSEYALWDDKADTTEAPFLFHEIIPDKEYYLQAEDFLTAAYKALELGFYASAGLPIKENIYKPKDIWHHRLGPILYDAISKNHTVKRNLPRFLQAYYATPHETFLNFSKELLSDTDVAKNVLDKLF